MGDKCAITLDAMTLHLIQFALHSAVRFTSAKGNMKENSCYFKERKIRIIVGEIVFVDAAIETVSPLRNQTAHRSSKIID
ncbi:hypothetical protein chiPu_0008290 [Chiloscyllium punctatum]|uniref:Uncharacterized protein n=1 Tax=Chiloscyllium punctatum TaxID=137246 RepID=A0A401SHH2_CHIPU|nr:hypothetical protein [Chiloscyllium punctatum]